MTLKLMSINTSSISRRVSHLSASSPESTSLRATTDHLSVTAPLVIDQHRTAYAQQPLTVQHQPPSSIIYYSASAINRPTANQELKTDQQQLTLPVTRNIVATNRSATSLEDHYLATAVSSSIS